ncbi:MAG: class I SAM-dependent methyltransferase [Planktomarina sp.]
MADATTVGVYDAKVEDYKKLTVSEPPAALIRFMDALPKGGRILDLGCGPGSSAAKMAREGFDVLAMDASLEMVKAAGQFDGVTAIQGTFDDIPNAPKFDGIFANFSLLHADRDDFSRHIAQIHGALVTGGMFHIGMKLGTGAARDGLGRFYTYYTVPELMDILENAGFTVTWYEEGKGPGMAGTVDPFVLMQAHA